MDDSQRKQRSINEQVLPHIPEHAWDSTVAIVIAHKDAVHQFGTGILFAVAERAFVVTAAHVFAKASELGKTIGITAAERDLIALKGTSFASTKGQYGATGDPFDVAVHPLSADAVDRLTGKHVLRLDDIELDDQSPTAVYSIFGYPEIWSRPSIAASDMMELKALQYTAYAYDRETDEFHGYQPRFHLLLDAQDEFRTFCDGSSAEFKTLDGQDASFPGDLGGISGCSVWRIGDLNVPIDEWGRTPPKIVAVQTSVYPRYKAIKATRWVAVTTLIASAFPELRPAIEMWRPC